MARRSETDYPMIPYDETVAEQTTARIARNPILVPNSYTMSFKNESFNATQHDIIIATFEQLQNSMSHGEVQPGRPFTAIISVRDFGDIRHKEWFLRNAVELIDLKFGFRYIRDERGNTNRVWGPFFTKVEDIGGTSLIRVTINPEVFPVLTYFGKGVGGTTLLKPHVYELENKYAKIFYEIMETYWKLGRWEAPLEDFRRVLGVSDKYTTGNLRRNILEPMQLLFQREDRWFDYELFCSSPVAGRKPRMDAIRLWFHDNSAGDTEASDYVIVYNVLSMVARSSGRAQDTVSVVDSICRDRRFHTFASRCRWYASEWRGGSMGWDHLCNTVRKILLEDLKVSL